MDIILLNPYFSVPKGIPNEYYAIVPLNLLYLATYLRKKRLDCKIYELGIHRTIKPVTNRFGLSNDEIEEIIKKEKPKIIGIGCMYTRHVQDVKELITFLRKITDAKIVVGGSHVSTLGLPTADYEIQGEGEMAFYDLCKSILSHKPVNRIIRYPLGNIDDFTLDYSLIDIKPYIEDTKISHFLYKNHSFGVISSRGCPYNCIFCTVKNVWGRSWRPRHPELFVKELEYLNKTYGIEEFTFLDDNISIDQQRWITILNLIKKRLNIKWTLPNGIAHWTLTPKILKLMQEAGCYRLTFGIESGNEKTRKFIRKTHNLQQAKDLIKYSNKIGMWTNTTNVIGFPFETKKQIWDTIWWNVKSEANFAGFYLLSPFPSSDVAQYFSQGIYNLSEEGVDTQYVTKEELKLIQKRGYMLLLATRIFKVNLLKKIRNWEDLKFTLRMVKNGIRIIFKSITMKNTLKLLYD